MITQFPVEATFFFDDVPTIGDDITYWFSIDDSDDANLLRSIIEDLDAMLPLFTFTETSVEDDANIRYTFLDDDEPAEQTVLLRDFDGVHSYVVDNPNVEEGNNEGSIVVDGGDETVFVFNNLNTGGTFMTADVAEAEFVEQNLGDSFDLVDEFTYDADGDVPVFRFFNTETGSHFYTDNAEEAAFVSANLTSFVDEGIAFFA